MNAVTQIEVEVCLDRFLVKSRQRRWWRKCSWKECIMFRVSLEEMDFYTDMTQSHPCQVFNMDNTGHSNNNTLNSFQMTATCKWRLHCTAQYQLEEVPEFPFWVLSGFFRYLLHAMFGSISMPLWHSLLHYCAFCCLLRNCIQINYLKMADVYLGKLIQQKTKLFTK